MIFFSDVDGCCGGRPRTTPEFVYTYIQFSYVFCLVIMIIGPEAFL